DVDGDGVPDLVFGCLDHGAFSAGQVRVCSGVDGTVLRAASGNNGDQLGFAVAGVGDLDGDGFDDYAAGAPLGLPSVHGYVRVWSGRTGAILQTMAGDAPQEWFGAAIAGVGDIDGDGVPDLGVGAPLATRRAPNGGFVRVYSGRNFAPIAEKTGNTTDENLGTSVAALGGDWDGDGLFDYVAGSPRNNEGAGTDSGSVFVFNLGGHVLHRFDGSPGDRLGAVVAGAGDVDGDGRPEVAGSALSRYVRVFAGRGDHALLHEFTAPQPRFGTAIDLRADLDCDGMADLVLGAAGGGGGNGVLQGLDLDHPGTPARVLVRGRACPTSAGRLPHLDPRGRPALGNAFAVRLRAAGVGAIAALAVGLPMQLDLTALGAPGCTAAVNPFGLLAAVTSATGVATFPIAVPRDTALLGVRLDCQSLVFDAGANALGIVFSTQLVAWIGR
ncbi:MAG: hypothetical protein MUC36_27755, partial [Planctomycetes bacterium]|nr:hypothetical protein [Planctomycetota bacterium]